MRIRGLVRQIVEQQSRHTGKKENLERLRLTAKGLFEMGARRGLVADQGLSDGLLHLKGDRVAPFRLMRGDAATSPVCSMRILSVV